MTKKSPTENLTITLPASVEKIIPPLNPTGTEKAEIHVKGAEPLYEEMRIANSLKDEGGNEVRLKEGATVNVTVKAPPQATTPKT